ncbi:hypothetical protein GOODEAATRI_034300 [Goodea atripinnis]|uniref:Uncharacterized protein n=1 Tax=Goodea atripinnis TaxID=208336 RepID=A0ABV0MN00_9TELE
MYHHAAGGQEVFTPVSAPTVGLNEEADHHQACQQLCPTLPLFFSSSMKISLSPGSAHYKHPPPPLFPFSELMLATEAVTSVVYGLVGRPRVAVQHLIQQGLCNSPSLLHDRHFDILLQPAHHLFFFMYRCMHILYTHMAAMLGCFAFGSLASFVLSKHSKFIAGASKQFQTELLPPHTYPRALHCSSSRKVNNSGYV